MAIVCSNCRLTIPDETSKFCPFCNALLYGFVTPVADPNAELVKCPKCHGSGFANEPTGRRRRFSIGRTCIMCLGAGTVTREMASNYRKGQLRQWLITLAFFAALLLIASIVYASTAH